MLISNRKVPIPFVGDAKIPKFWPGIKNFIISTPNMTFLIQGQKFGIFALPKKRNGYFSIGNEHEMNVYI